MLRNIIVTSALLIPIFVHDLDLNYLLSKHCKNSFPILTSYLQMAIESILNATPRIGAGSKMIFRTCFPLISQKFYFGLRVSVVL